jgi:DNA topoisomerase I
MAAPNLHIIPKKETTGVVARFGKLAVYLPEVPTVVDGWKLIKINGTPEPEPKPDTAVEKFAKFLVRAAAPIDPEGKWVTINGTHVHLDSEGSVDAGPRVMLLHGPVDAHPDKEQWPSHIKALKLPPAWKNVRYSTNPESDLQAIGEDAKGRKQYVYSKRFQAQQAAAKFERIKELHEKYPGIYKQNEENLRSPDPRIREHAEASKLIMTMGLRPGGEGNTLAEKQAYGATTLLGKHVVTDGGSTNLKFTGKKGVALNLPVTDPHVESYLKSRAGAAGSEGQLFPNVSAASLSDYTHGFGDFKTKDFRTLLGTKTAMDEVQGMPIPTDAKSYKKSVAAVAKTVSTKLGNTPTIALQSYISPEVFTQWRSHVGI